MARVRVPYPLSGSIGGLVFYQRKDSKDKTFVRTQGEGPHGRQRSSREQDNRRWASTEMQGRAAMAQDLRRVLHPLAPMRTGNWQSGLSGALRPVQLRDTVSAYGERAVLLSQHGHLLEGYSLNKRLALEAVVRSPLDYSVDKIAGTAVLHLPELVAGANWQVPGPYSWARWVAVLGAVPDQQFVPGRGYTPAGDHYPEQTDTFFGDWQPVKGGAPPLTIDLALTNLPPTPGFALVLAAGIVLGAVNGEGVVGPVGYAGAGKIVAAR